MEQKVIRIGSSIGIVIPKPLAEERGIKAGTKVRLKTTEGSNDIIIESPQVKGSVGNTALVAWAEEAVERYRPALQALKDK